MNGVSILKPFDATCFYNENSSLSFSTTPPLCLFEMTAAIQYALLSTVGRLFPLIQNKEPLKETANAENNRQYCMQL